MTHIKNLENSKLLTRYPDLSNIQLNIIKAINEMIHSYKAGGKVLVAGNGGSSADAEHFCGELNKGFTLNRKVDSYLNAEDAKNFADFDFSKLQGGLPAIPINSLQSTISASANDLSWEYAFAQTLNSLGNNNDLFIGITTSGNSMNILRCFQLAKIKGLKSILLSGSSDSKCSQVADISIKAPSAITHHVQEFHLPIYHAICLEIEHFFWSS